MSFSDRQGILRRRISHDDHNREYLLYIPPDYSDQIDAPVVLNFHGYASSALDQLRLSDWRKLADENNIILIYPQGLEMPDGEKKPAGQTHWNPDPLSDINKSDSKDLGFVMKLLRRISRRYSVDLSSIFATGFSNGADMAYGLASYGSNFIAGIAPVSGLMSETNLSMSLDNEVGVISFNGTNDWVRPLRGIEGYLASTVDTSNYWAQVNNSFQAQFEQFVQESGYLVDRTTFLKADGSSTVQQYIVNGGGHEWFDLNIEGSDLNQLAWSFFSGLAEEGVQSKVHDDNTNMVDIDGDGFVDEITNYQMWISSGGVDLTNRRGRTYSDNTSRKWDAIKAVESDPGFSVLVEGHLSKEGKYKVVTAGDEGVISRATRWLNGNQMLGSGYEEVFSMDFNGNGVVDLV